MTERNVPTTAVISEIAGVSKSTASRALNNDPRISDKTRKKIWTIAEELGYAPNAIAQSLATQRSQIIGFIWSEVENYWYQENIQQLVAAIAAAGMQTMIFQVPVEGDVLEIVPQMLRYRLAGCIVIPTVQISRRTLDVLDRYKIPVVLLNTRARGSRAFSVACDQVAGARAIAQLLTAAGHTRIAFIAGPNTPTARGREEGFVTGLSEAGQSLFARGDGDFTFAGAHGATLKLLKTKPYPDAIFAANDLMAFAVLDALRESGLKVPDDVSVVGFDNSRTGSWAAYALTTVAQPIGHMFSRAVEMIVAQNAETARRSEAITVDGELVLRRSARLPSDFSKIEIIVRGDPPGQSGAS